MRLSHYRLAVSSLALVAALSSSTTLAERGARPQERRERKEQRDEGARGRREEMQERRAAQLTAALATRAGLDAGKTEKLGAALRAHMQKRQEERRARRAEAQALRVLLDAKAADAEVGAQLDKLMEQLGQREDMQALLSALGSFLSVQERARVAVFFPEAMRDTRRALRDARGLGTTDDDDEE